MALLPSAFDVGSISDTLNESYKSQEVTSMPRNELHCIIQVSCFGTLLKGQLSKDLLFVLHSQLFSRGALKPTEGQTRL